jgi:hypothetical protein
MNSHGGSNECKGCRGLTGAIRSPQLYACVPSTSFRLLSFNGFDVDLYHAALDQQMLCMKWSGTEQKRAARKVLPMQPDEKGRIEVCIIPECVM